MNVILPRYEDETDEAYRERAEKMLAWLASASVRALQQKLPPLFVDVGPGISGKSAALTRISERLFDVPRTVTVRI